MSSTSSSLVFAEADSEEESVSEHLFQLSISDSDFVSDKPPSRLRRWMAGYGVSLFVHGIFLLATALIVYQVQKFNWHDSIQSSMTQGLGGLGSAGGLEPMLPIEFQVSRELQISPSIIPPIKIPPR